MKFWLALKYDAVVSITRVNQQWSNQLKHNPFILVQWQLILYTFSTFSGNYTTGTLGVSKFIYEIKYVVHNNAVFKIKLRGVK